MTARGARAAAAAALVGLLCAGGAAAQEARPLFAAAAAPAPGGAEVHGRHAGGCVAGAVALAPEGPGWQTIRLERNRFWGHPALIAFIERLGAQALRRGWPHGVLIGDLGQPRGGPVSGHASHQSGLDVDIWLRPPSRDYPRAARAGLSYLSFVGGGGRRVTEGWTAAHAALVEAAARDAAVDRIFVNAAIKRDLCRRTGPADAAWMRKIGPWWRHDGHMHVRLSCPDGSPGCVDQNPVPPGDGCDAALDWWFSEEALNPAPPATPPTPKPPATLADLPPACASVLRR
jgi:penicillin-insensitive murein endopeptidase